MSDRLSKEQIEDLIEYCGSSVTRWRADDILVCCPVHGESHPSLGISEDKQLCHCFSCGFAGNFASLLYHSLPDDFGYDPNNPKTNTRAYWKAKAFLKDRYELEYRMLGEKTRKTIRRYEDHAKELVNNLENNRVAIPLYKIAPYMSGKETYQYFFDRAGDFDREDLKKFMIGRDLINKTVTIPVFHEDGTLAGVLGRYISKKRRKNERYKVYDFQKGDVLYPLNHFKPINNTIILIEGNFDAMRLHKLGYTNALSKMGVELTEKQADYICKNCDTVIDLCDNDSRGLEGRDKDQATLGNRVKFKIVDYPEHGKDPCDWSEEEIAFMIENAHSPMVRKLRRYEE